MKAHKIRAAWWRRLEARVVAALIVLGVISVGASSYLVSLTVRYFDSLGEARVSLAQDAIDHALPFYEEMVAAKREAFEARTHALALELAALDPATQPAARRDRMQAELDGRPDVVRIELTVGREGPVVAARDEAPEIAVKTSAASGSGELEVTYAVDPGLDVRLQQLGEMRRAVESVEVEGGRVDREQLEPAVATAVSVASGLVLLVAFVVGFVVARSTTRKVSDISEVLRRIARGELDARAPPLGDDEIGVLASDLNATLDQLDQARRRVAYLQRIGAWQEVARRIAHEIKNPLTPIQLAVQQLREKAPKDDAAFSRLLTDSVEIIEDEIEGLRRMVSSFSQFAKVPEVRLEPLEVGKLLTEFERAYGHLGDGDDDRLEVVAPGRELQLDGDRQLLKQVLVNLVENAALSARESGVDAVHVRVRARAEEVEGEDWVVVEVEDNGPGIDPERSERVFEPYETTREQGTGLGLAIVKKVVLDHGGEISVDASPDLSGARFVIRLPARAPLASASKNGA